MRWNLLEKEGVLARRDVLFPGLDLGLLSGRIGRHDAFDDRRDLHPDPIVSVWKRD
jgi:hypothetical protein